MTDRTTTVPLGATSAPGASGVPAQLRRRHAAAARTAPLPCGTHRDPELHEVAPAAPSTYGLTARELRAEADRLTARGWSVAEVAARLNLRKVATA
ncbi:hypothetical protein ACIHBQ_04970 [Streptomyces sp. NPDC052492]|uniref:hypothetical protein n=1 Tax=Streptomyces sp. NPDC052492 TaxID=3365691 RepID=UPI0037D866A3